LRLFTVLLGGLGGVLNPPVLKLGPRSVTCMRASECGKLNREVKAIKRSGLTNPAHLGPIIWLARYFEL
jgi:hypothetical protein